MRLFLLLFITIPIVEMWLLIQVGAEIGALSTIFLVFLTAATGLALLRHQGVDTLLRLNRRVEQGQLPADEIMEGIALAVGGALLLTPGFITDAIGFICLLPTTRKLLVVGLLKRGMRAASTSAGNTVHMFHSGDGFSAAKNGGGNTEKESESARGSSTTIDGEYKREE